MSRLRSFRMSPRRVLAALPGVAVAVALAGCGSTGAASGTVTNAASPSGNGTDPGLELARCMRAHGVSTFPDPNGHGIQITPQIAQSPAFKTAQVACEQYLPNGGAPPVTAPGDRAAALAFAKCMRTHGIPDFPDPLTSVPSSPPAGRWRSWTCMGWRSSSDRD
jgi:hypothetical protein